MIIIFYNNILLVYSIKKHSNFISHKKSETKPVYVIPFLNSKLATAAPSGFMKIFYDAMILPKNQKFCDWIRFILI